MKHLYVAFWRPDILAQFQASGATAATICDTVVTPDQCTSSLQETTCPACRETFLEAVLPTGSGKRMTWTEYLAAEAAREAERKIAEEAKRKADAAAWSSAPGGGWSVSSIEEAAPVSDAAWSSLPTKNDGWGTS